MAHKNTIRKLAQKKGVHIHKDDRKFYELVVLLADRSKDDPLFGAIKLNKLLFYCDFLAYALLGKPITGQEYFALQNGPAPRHKVVHWDKMVRRKDIAIRRESTRFDNEREVTLALRDPDVTVFTSPELDIVYKVLAHSKDMAGSDLSKITHKFPGWELAREKEVIPYPVALVGNRHPTPAELKYARALQEELAIAA
jgi:uncharacterized phage-associated protein